MKLSHEDFNLFRGVFNGIVFARRAVPLEPRKVAEFNLARMLRDEGVTDAAGVVDALTHRFLRVPITGDRRAALVAFCQKQMGGAADRLHQLPRWKRPTARGAAPDPERPGISVVVRRKRMPHINCPKCSMSRREMLRAGFFGLGVRAAVPTIFGQTALSLAAQEFHGKESASRAHPGGGRADRRQRRPRYRHALPQRRLPQGAPHARRQSRTRC